MAQAATGVRAIKRDTPFAWEGKDKRGARVKGKSLAPDEQSLRAELRRQGVAPSRIRKQRQRRTGGKVNAGDIAIFSRQLSTMLAAGIPLVQAFEIVGNGNDKASMQRLILDVKADVEGGTSLHESLAKHPLHFDDLFVNLVEAGEHAGALESLLDKVATLSSSDSSAPACSPASTRFTNRSSKCSGCLASDSWSEVPPATSDLTSRISLCMAALSLPLPTISNACTSGMPAASMVESWRLKIAISPALTLPPARL